MENTIIKRRSVFLIVFLFLSTAIYGKALSKPVLVPVVDGPWWQVADNPMDHKYATEKQQPVDFAVWQAADGTWQLWSCIRHTKAGGEGGRTRFFYGWEGKNLTDSNWKPEGIKMEADPSLGETPGGLQAPHVIKVGDTYHMFYGDWVNICQATSKDGKNFQRVIQPNGKTGMFSEGPGSITRDPMLIQIDGLWYCYYTALPGGKGYGFCRTSPDLEKWSYSCVVSYGGKVGSDRFQNECPHVVEVEPGVFYYFRNQFYGKNARNWVYRSDNPLNFGIDDDSKLVRSWHLAAPELIRYEGQYYIAALKDTLDGIKIARLKWIKLPELGKSVFDFDSTAGRNAWTLKSGNLASIFTNSKRSNFKSRTEYFIGTAEIGKGKFDDKRAGVIESPVFTLEQDSYILFVSGGDDRQNVYVALIEAGTEKQIARLTGKNDNTFEKIPVDCSGAKGKRVFIRIVDKTTVPWGHINFGGMYEDPLAPYND